MRRRLTWAYKAFVSELGIDNGEQRERVSEIAIDEWRAAHRDPNMSAQRCSAHDNDKHSGDDMLPESLVCLLGAALAVAQARQELQLNQVASFSTLRLSSRPSFSIPQQNQLSVSIALCSTSNSIPRFFLTNASNSDLLADPGPTTADAFQIPLQSGQGSYTGVFPNGGILAVDTEGVNEGIFFDIGVSIGDGMILQIIAVHMAQQFSDPIHKTLNDLPYFGDTTSNQALVLSHVFAKIDTIEPTYPNYTLPAANMSQPPPPTNPPNMTLVIAPTSVGLANGPRTGCFLSAQRSVGNIANESSWARDESGLRTQWLMGGLSPSTNYTAFVLQDTTHVSGPIYFTTKSG